MAIYVLGDSRRPASLPHPGRNNRKRVLFGINPTISHDSLLLSFPLPTDLSIRFSHQSTPWKATLKRALYLHSSNHPIQERVQFLTPVVAVKSSSSAVSNILRPLSDLASFDNDLGRISIAFALPRDVGARKRCASTSPSLLEFSLLHRQNSRPSQEVNR